jgi:translation initiation factor 1
MADRKNLFEMGAKFDNGWSSDNKTKSTAKTTLLCKELLVPSKHQLHFAKERRRGKTVTIVKPFCLERGELKDLLKLLKKRLGTGGTIKDSSLEFQGELQDALKRELEMLDYRFR